MRVLLNERKSVAGGAGEGGADSDLGGMVESCSGLSYGCNVLLFFTELQ